MVGRFKYFGDAVDFLFEFLRDRFDHCFPSTGMSETQYAEALADLVSSEVGKFVNKLIISDNSCGHY